MIPDGEHLVSTFLREHPAVVELGARVVGRSPSNTTLPWVRVTVLDAPQEDGSDVDHLVEFFLQLDCYAGKTGVDGSQQAEATLLARTVRQALPELRAATLEDAVVSRVQVGGGARVPDQDFEPARERVILTARVWAHSTPSGG